MFNRSATLMYSSDDGKRKIYIDDKNRGKILTFLKSEKGMMKKFEHIVKLLLEHPPGATRHIYGLGNIEQCCEFVTAIKPFPGSIRNSRIYCQHHHRKDNEQIIITAELLEKKKSQKLTILEKEIIRRVAAYNYQLKD